MYLLLTSPPPPPPPGRRQSAASAVLMEKESGAVLYEKDARQKLEPASVTKIMTLLLVMEALDAGRIALDDMVTVSAYAAGMGGSQVYLKEGEQMTVAELLKCGHGGLGQRRRRGPGRAPCRQRGGLCGPDEPAGRASWAWLTPTSSTAPACPPQGHLTSAYDIALMSRELILNHPGIREYTTIWMDSIRDGAFGLTNTNRLVRFYQGATGLKTGSTDSALYCMSATAERDGMELIAVVHEAPPPPPSALRTPRPCWTTASPTIPWPDVYPDAPLAPGGGAAGRPRTRSSPSWQRECRLLVRKGEEGQITTQLQLARGRGGPGGAGAEAGADGGLCGRRGPGHHPHRGRPAGGPPHHSRHLLADVAAACSWPASLTPLFSGTAPGRRGTSV